MEIILMSYLKRIRDLRKRLKEPDKILGKNLWVMGPLKETTVEKIARKRVIAPV